MARAPYEFVLHASPRRSRGGTTVASSYRESPERSTQFLRLSSFHAVLSQPFPTDLFLISQNTMGVANRGRFFAIAIAAAVFPLLADAADPPRFRLPPPQQPLGPEDLETNSNREAVVDMSFEGRREVTLLAHHTQGIKLRLVLPRGFFPLVLGIREGFDPARPYDDFYAYREDVGAGRKEAGVVVTSIERVADGDGDDGSGAEGGRPVQAECRVSATGPGNKTVVLGMVAEHLPGEYNPYSVLVRFV
ncbi:hypothetical protein CSUI_009722 [Cystoisospora suis]|uniref:Uncharacterized protein n=1 Tax=Cystoisospora suis TaxID=483139 RepID=A0A2C6K1W7_9APIC|nr:hypothetical protein CSUI_009722 [Cystoisospora suis]